MPISDFCDECRAANTRRNYLTSILSFLDFIYNPQLRPEGRKIAIESVIPQYEKLAGEYISSKPNAGADLKRWALAMRDVPPTTVKTRISVTVQFLEYHGIMLSVKDKRTVRQKMPLGGVRTIERDLDHETLRTLLAYMDVRGRAFTLTLIATGGRTGEIMQALVQDLRLDTHPAELFLREQTTKNKKARTVFLTKEAAEAVQTWLRVRDDYLDSAQYRNAGLVKAGIAPPKTRQDDRIFPFADPVLRKFWNGALKKAGLHSQDPSTGRLQVHPHMMRKFFRTQMATVIPVDVVEDIMGHAGYLTDPYRKNTKKQLAEFYLKGEHILTIQIPADMVAAEGALKQKLEVHSGLIIDQAQKIDALEKEIEMIKEGVAILLKPERGR